MDHKIFWQLNEAYQLGVCNQVQEETLSEEEYLDIEEWVEALVDEGYDLDQYTDDELYEAYLVDLEEAKYEAGFSDNQKKAVRKARNSDPGSKKRPEYQNTHLRALAGSKGYENERDNRYLVAQNRKKAGFSKDNWDYKVWHPKYKKVGGAKGLPEELDLYDLVSEYLVSEGFCDYYEDADVIMANMSEEWREGIVDIMEATQAQYDRLQQKLAAETDPQRRSQLQAQLDQMATDQRQRVLNPKKPKSRQIIRNAVKSSVRHSLKSKPAKAVGRFLKYTFLGGLIP